MKNTIFVWNYFTFYSLIIYTDFIYIIFTYYIFLIRTLQHATCYSKVLSPCNVTLKKSSEIFDLLISGDIIFIYAIIVARNAVMFVKRISFT